MTARVGVEARAGLGVYGGLFFTTLATLTHEILLTRIFSVTMWYHFAFVAVSVALFGLTVGALIVHLAPHWFAPEHVRTRLAQASLLFAITIVLSFLAQLQIDFDATWTAGGIASVVGTYAVVSVPFIFSGIAVSLSLTKFPSQVSRLYAVDLIGAGLGTVTLIWLLDVLRDGPSAVLAVAGLAALGAVSYALAGDARRVAGLAAASAVVLGGLAIGNAVSVQQHEPVLRIAHAKGIDESVPLYETWNAFSRIRVNGRPGVFDPPASTPDGTFPPLRQLSITIDARAGTTMTAFDGDIAMLKHYFRDYVVNAAHFIRPDSSVFIVGAGGGWDILAALAFDQPSITGVELNGDILEIVNGRYGDFTGHLDQRDDVRFVHAEARSYLARSGEAYDIVHIPMTDTWAATAAGAFSLSENGLYTVEAWRLFYEHLTERGVLSLNRWYFVSRPMEAYRLTSLAAETLHAEGVADPRDHIMLVKSADIYPNIAVATILVARQPFTPADVATMRSVAEERGWEVLLAPDGEGADPLFATIVAAEDAGSIELGFPGDISPPTDDRPFFFQMVGFGDLFDSALYDGFNDNLTRPVLILFSLTLTVAALTAVFIVGPLLIATSRRALRGSAPLVLFFAAIGLGFLLLEIAQMQRLIIFLGHPTYALSVVLLSLLVFSGIGSLATERVVAVSPNPGPRPGVLWPLGALLAVLLAFGFLTPAAIDWFKASTTPVRIGAAVGILAPMGLLMGMPFPLGMKVASLRPEAPTAFFWGINGATSVCASVLAVAISLGWGISMAFWAGCLAYAVAAAALALVVLRQHTPLAAVA